MSEALESATEPEDVIAALLPKLRSDKITFFPIRHHSPACAIHVERWIRKHKPQVVLVEGPASFTDRIERLIDPLCIAPVALYTNFVDKKGRIAALIAKQAREKLADKNDIEKLENEGEAKSEPAETPSPGLFDTGPSRFAAYYPFCDYSPELVALRVGKEVGAKLRFIDMEYAEMVLTEVSEERVPDNDLFQVASLADDSHMRHSQYIKALAANLGCRDADEVWDHLFETAWVDLNTEAFINRVAVYCTMARLGYTKQQLVEDGTVAREQRMAEAIEEELATSKGPILVVTGGFHTAALPYLIGGCRADGRKSPRTAFDADEIGVWLMRYSFDRLDALTGYSAGMRSPEFYDRLWRAGSLIADGDSQLEHTPRMEKATADFAIDIARLTRERKLPAAISTPDAIAAVQMAKQLSKLRGHPWPMREDMLDGIRACFVKGEIGVEGHTLLVLVKEVFGGNRVGTVPAGGEQPPIVADLYREAGRFRINLEVVQSKEYSLELYRNSNHRSLSRFFHRLDLLNAPLATWAGGPDFVTGQRLDMIQEHWVVTWSPMVESALIEASLFGTTIEEAAGNRLKTQIADLEKNGEGRSSSAAVVLLIRACRLGLHAQGALMVPLIDIHINEDPKLLSVVMALSQLDLLQSAREPLEASALGALDHLIQAAYRRSCRLLLDSVRCANDLVEETISALKTLREVLASRTKAKATEADDNLYLDRTLFFEGLKSIVNFPPAEAQSAIVGAAAGILYGEGYFTNDALIKVILGYLGGALNDPRKSVGILQGLLSTACEVAWQVSELMKALDEQMESWDEDTFVDLLPELRLAFAALAPREIARLAEKVSAMHDGVSLGDLIHTDLAEQDMTVGMLLNRRVKESLVSDGLGAS